MQFYYFNLKNVRKAARNMLDVFKEGCGVFWIGFAIAVRGSAG